MSGEVLGRLRIGRDACRSPRAPCGALRFCADDLRGVSEDDVRGVLRRFAQLLSGAETADHCGELVGVVHR